jgi:hypothetical protein
MLNGEIHRGNTAWRNAMKTPWTLAAMLLFMGSSLVATLAGGGANFDHLTDADRNVFQERFTKEIWPLMERNGKNGCVGCHNGKIVSSLKMTGKAEKDFRMLVKDGFFIPDDSGSVLTRATSNVLKKKMPPPGKGDPWTKAEVGVLEKFVAELDKKQQKKTK